MPWDMAACSSLCDAVFWRERNDRHFEDCERTMLEFKLFFFQTLYEWVLGLSIFSFHFKKKKNTWAFLIKFLTYQKKKSFGKASLSIKSPHHGSCQNLIQRPFPTSNFMNLEKFDHPLLICFQRLAPQNRQSPPKPKISVDINYLMSCFHMVSKTCPA